MRKCTTADKKGWTLVERFYYRVFCSVMPARYEAVVEEYNEILEQMDSALQFEKEKAQMDENAIRVFTEELAGRTASVIGWGAVREALEKLSPIPCEKNRGAIRVLSDMTYEKYGGEAQDDFNWAIDGFSFKLRKTITNKVEHAEKLQEYAESLFFTEGKDGPDYRTYQEKLDKHMVVLACIRLSHVPEMPERIIDTLRDLEEGHNRPKVQEPFQDLQWELDARQKEDEHVKRFRTPDGALTMPVDMIAKLTRTEADAYFVDGADYIFQGEAYKLHRFLNKDAHGEMTEVAKFVSADGKQLFTDPERLGTFLPDVASDGQEITKADRVLSCANEFAEEEELEI